MNPINLNPSSRFFHVYEKDILLVRENLFNQLEKITPEFSHEVRSLFEYKLKNNDYRPPLGELFPWIIKDLTNMDSKVTNRISLGWFAIYLYTLFLDEFVDYKKNIKPEIFLAGSILAKIGLTNLSKIVNGTKYEEMIDHALNESALNQLRDVQKQGTSESLFEKEEYSSGKNKIIYACAGAFAASNSKYDNFIIEFTKSLLLSLQYLDDIADIEEDYFNNNYTVLLHDINDEKTKQLFIKNSSVSYRLILSQLIDNGSLERVTEKLYELLSRSIFLIDKILNIDKTKLESYIFFTTLNDSIKSLNSYLNIQTKNFRMLENKKREIILDQVEQHIKYIAQSS